jgi:hypothetical protein
MAEGGGVDRVTVKGDRVEVEMTGLPRASDSKFNTHFDAAVIWSTIS